VIVFAVFKMIVLTQFKLCNMIKEDYLVYLG